MNTNKLKLYGLKIYYNSGYCRFLMLLGFSIAVKCSLELGDQKTVQALLLRTIFACGPFLIHLFMRMYALPGTRLLIPDHPYLVCTDFICLDQKLMKLIWLGADLLMVATRGGSAVSFFISVVATDDILVGEYEG